MKISFNPSNSNKNILDLIKNNKDIIFDLKGHSIFARGVEFKGTDTNTWRPVVDNLTSDSTTSSLSAKQGKVLKALIDGKSNSDHNHDGRYLKLTGGTMASNALITFADSGSWDTSKKPQGARGGLYWTGQSDYAKLYAEETVGDNLDLVIQFGDDNSNGLSIRNKANTQTSYISSSGVITTGTFKGNLDWSYITNKPATATRWPSWAEVTGKPSSFTPSTHTHGLSNSVFFLNMPSINGNAKWKEVFGYPVNYNLLLSVRINNPAPEWCVGNFGSGILYGGSDTKGFMSSAYNEPFIMWAGGNGSSDDSVPKWYIGIKGTHKSIYNLATIASEANAAYNLRHSHANKSVLDGITSALVNSWNTAYNFVSNITGTDTDKVINKWEEIVNFLAGITEDNKLNTLLNSKLSVYELADNTNVGTIKNNGIYYSTTDASSRTLINSPFNTGFAFINMTSYDGGDDLRRSRLAFNAFGEIKVSDDRDQANTAETWYNVLTSKNSGINGSTIKLNGTSITVYSSGTADGRYVKKSGDTMQGVLTIDTTNFGALTIKRNDDANGASIQFRGKSSVYGYIGLNNSTKDKQFLRWSSDISRVYTILDTSSTYISNGKGVINGTTITQVDNATNSTNSTNARKLVNWYSARPTSLNAQFGDGSLRIFYATSSTTEGKPAEDSHILHLAWDNTGGYDAQLAVHIRSGKVSTRAQNDGTWQPWKTLAFTTDIPSSLKNPYSFNVFGVAYDGSAAKTVTTSTFVSQLPEGPSTVTDGTMFITSWASNSGFADTNAVNVPYKRKAICLWEYIKAKTDSLYATNGHNHDGRYLRLSGQDTMQGNLYLHSHGTSYIGKGLGDKSGADFTEANIVIRSWWGISFKSCDDIVRTYIDTRTGNIGTKGVLNAVGAVIQGRVYNGGDDEGIIINPASNGYAGLILGTHNGERSVFYLTKGNPFWRYNNGSTNLDIQHPKKPGVIALTSDIPSKDSWNYDDRYLRLTGGWMSGDINFGGDKKIHWGRNTDSASISFKNDGDANSYMSFVTSDNGNEYFRWSHSSGSTNTEWMALRSDGLRVRGTKVSLEGHTHTVFKNNLMIKGTNGISDSASIHLGIGDSDTGFKWISDGVCQIYANNAAVGQWTSGGMNWFKNPTVNGNKVWNAGNDGSGSGLDADTLDGYHAASFVKMYTGRFNQYNKGTWTKILQFTIPSGHLQPTISFIWHPTECARDVWADFNINIRSGSPIFYVNWKGTTRRTVYCVGDGTTYSVWVQGTKSQWDPFGLVQVISTWQINTYQAGCLQYSDSEPTGTYKVVASMSGIIMYADRLLTARKINGTSFDGTSDITTAYWGTTRTISLTGAITGSVSTNGGGNITINTTYGTGNITNLDNRYVKKAGDTMQGNLTFTSGKQTRWTAKGISYITDGNIDSGTSLGGNLANLVISSWYGVSFTTSCSGQTYTNKTAVGINCRAGIVYAANFVGPLQGNAATATKLQTSRSIWGQSFDGTRDVSGTLSGVANIQFSADGAYDIGSNSATSRYIYTHWLGAKSGSKLELGANNSGFGQGLCIDTNLNVGIGTNSPTQKLDVIGNIRATGQLYLPTNGNYNAILMGDDCWMGDCNISNVIGLSGTNNANSGGIKFGKGGMYIGYNGSSHYSSGTSLWTNFNADTVDGEHASNFSYTHQSSFDFSKRKSGRIVTFDQSGTDYGWINGFASTHNNYLTSVIFNEHRSSNWYVGYMEGNMSTGETNGLQAVHKLALADGDESYPIFLGYLNLFNGNDGTISSSFPCLGYSVPFTYTRGGAYCLISIPNTSFQTFYIKAAIASVHYSGAGMGNWVGNHRGDGAWWLHCAAVGSNAVQVKGFHPGNKHNNSWWGGNPLYSSNGAAKIITVCLFGHVKYK